MLEITLFLAFLSAEHETVSGWKGRDYTKGLGVNYSLSPWIGKYLIVLLMVPII